MPIEAVYELSDASDDETYWPLGIFLSLEDAIAAVEGCEEPWGLPDHETDDYCKLAINERPIGFGGAGKCVWKRTWVERYCEETDDSQWHQEEDER